jgi:hypothetical protein
MGQSRAFGFGVYLVIGWTIRYVAEVIEAIGDGEAFPLDRFMLHSLALLVNFAALACFLRALYMLFRKRSPESGPARYFDEPPSEDDAPQLRRAEPRVPAPPSPPAGTFGRRQV